ncbi:uncharacterized protein BDCG_16615 [Blastomyces dermatitidis ER-3]|uniref:Uncharacterized protein n=2 Tax=Ajellomyces dermatitidis TaxID=5039 RepID=A0A0J9EMZ4_AJEDA|nr:uncharacterized protein BDCG_16615 [Blastomyces dermatitidis ER-3]KMW66595.1 hypothetical protein BDDG_11603 [Blastomyces dermatitidis ATCC 18188]OAT00412.1 hypothetical protein BDCG_16615 [Blastomyces dermatitidis ER-3]
MAGMEWDMVDPIEAKIIVFSGDSTGIWSFWLSLVFLEKLGCIILTPSGEVQRCQAKFALKVTRFYLSGLILLRHLRYRLPSSESLLNREFESYGTTCSR